MANIPLLLLVVLEICVAATAQDVLDYPPPVPSGKSRKNPRTYHKYEGLHFSKRQCSEVQTFTNKPLEFCAGECDYSGRCTAFNWKELGGKVCSLISCGLNIPYPTGGEYDGYSAVWGWSGYTAKEIPVGKTYYHGPYKYFFGHKRQRPPCGQLGPTLYDKTYGLCEEACDAQLGCTGFNFHIHAQTGKCELRGCSSAVSRPGEYLEGWEGWSKAEIKLPEPDPKCPSPKCSAKGNKARNSNYHEHNKYHFNGRQCSHLKLEKKPPIPYAICAFACDDSLECTAFNYKQNGGECSLRSCGAHVPFPIGALYTAIKTKGWKGYTLQEIPGGYSYYDGPYGLYWGYACPQIGNDLKDMTYVLCEEKCDAKRECTGFNFNIETFACELRKCPTPTTKPTDYLSIWESWSKIKINAYPPKCPSFKCKRSTIIPKPYHQDHCIGGRQRGCRCDDDPWCYWNCSKCEVDGSYWGFQLFNTYTSDFYEDHQRHPST